MWVSGNPGRFGPVIFGRHSLVLGHFGLISELNPFTHTKCYRFHMRDTISRQEKERRKSKIGKIKKLNVMSKQLKTSVVAYGMQCDLNDSMSGRTGNVRDMMGRSIPGRRFH